MRDDEVLVGTTVRIDPGKGVLDFARSFSYLDAQTQSKVKYIIVGEPTRKGQRKPDEPPYEPHCEAYLQEIKKYVADNKLEGRVIFTGYRDEVTDYLSAMDMYVFPSRDEMYSISVLEAMAASLPIVAANAGGNLEQVRDGVNGLLFEVDDSKDIATKIAYYLQHPEKRSQHGAAALSFVEQRHDMRRTIEQLLKFYSGNA